MFIAQENIFGEDQAFTDMGTSNCKSTLSNLTHLKTQQQQIQHTNSTAANKEDNTKSISEVSISAEEKPKRFDARLYRPLEVTVSLTIHDIQAHLVKVNKNNIDVY